MGLVVFAVSSLLCAIAPTGWVLVGARCLQGVGAAFLYAAVALGTPLVALFLQEAAGLSATQAGFATLPIPVLSFFQARDGQGSGAMSRPGVAVARVRRALAVLRMQQQLAQLVLDLGDGHEEQLVAALERLVALRHDHP